MPLLPSVSKSFPMTRRSSVKFSLSHKSCIIGALMVLLLPLPLLAAAMAAAAVHECCHIIALTLCRVQILDVTIRSGGAEIRTAPIMPAKELLCAAAGPVGSFLCLLLRRQLPLLSLCGLIQGFYNLLPIYPMDGGRMLRAVAALLFPRYAERICCIVAGLASFSLLAACAGLWIHTMDAFFLLIGAYFALQTPTVRKIPCKARPHWVQ